jgi:hypothetical protein
MAILISGILFVPAIVGVSAVLLSKENDALPV